MKIRHRCSCGRLHECIPEGLEMFKDNGSPFEGYYVTCDCGSTFLIQAKADQEAA